MDWRRNNLPSRVVTDSEMEHRVPPTHLDNYSDVDCLDGCDTMRSVTDSGVGLSFKSTDSDSFPLREAIEQMSLEPALKQWQSETLEGKPRPSVDTLDKTVSVNVISLDEGFSSGGLPSETSFDHCLDKCYCPVSDLQTPKDNPQTKRRSDIAAIFSQDEDGDTQLHIAIIQGKDVLAIQMINLVFLSDFLNVSNSLLQTPLHIAVITNQPSIVRHLVIMGAAVDARDRHGNTPLHLACRDGHLECVKSLTMAFSEKERETISSWALMQNIPQDGNIKNYEGETCLHIAELHHHLPVLSYLVNQVGFDINMKDGRSGRTVLHYAVDMGWVDMVEEFLHFKCDVNARTFDGTTPLQLAHGRGQEQAVQLLLGAGADPDQITFDDSYSDMESEDEMMDSQVNDVTFYDDFTIAGQPIASV